MKQLSSDAVAARYVRDSWHVSVDFNWFSCSADNSCSVVCYGCAQVSHDARRRRRRIYLVVIATVAATVTAASTIVGVVVASW